MPWRCPGCQNIIEHEGDTPKVETLYRCHRCRISLKYNPVLKRLTAVRVDDNFKRPPKKK